MLENLNTQKYWVQTFTCKQRVTLKSYRNIICKKNVNLMKSHLEKIVKSLQIIMYNW